MARAKRHYILGHVWHLTHRCHKREFLLRFAKDRQRWLQWLFEESVSFQSTDGTVEEAFIGDTMGSEAAEGVEIGLDCITLHTETTMIRMPVLAGGFQKN